MATTKVQSELIVDDVALAGNPTTSTQSAGNNTTRIATTAFVTTAVNNLIDSAPGTMDTLNEIAAALGDDPSFTTTVNNAIALKAPLANPTFTGVATAPAVTLGTDPGGDAYNTTSPLKIGSTTNAYINIKAGTGHSGGLLIGDSDDDFVGGFIYSNSTDDLSIYSNNAVRMVLNDNGRVVIGGGADPRTLGFGDTGVQIEGTGATSASLSIVRNSASLDPPYLIFGKSRGGALGANTVVQNGDYLGNIRFNAADGTDAGNVAAQIHAQIDGTPGANDTPGKLVFSTTADGNNTPTARMTIKSNGNVDIAGNIQLTGGGTIEAPSSSGSENLLLKAAGGIHLTLDSNGNGGDDQLFKIMKHTSDLVFQVKEDGEVYTTNHAGIGIDDPQVRLHVYHPTTNVVARFESGDSQTWIDLHDNSSGSYGCLVGHDSTHDFIVANDAVTKMLMIRRSSRMVEIGNGYGIAVETGRAAAVQVNASGYTNVLNFNTIGTGDSRGFYLVSASRNGGSVGTHWIGLVGASSSTASYIYEVLQNSGITAQFSGSWLQLQSSSTHDVHVTAIPIGIHGNDS